MTIDDDECIEGLTDEEIISIVKNTEEEVIDLNDNNNIAPRIVSFEEVRESFETILKFFNNRRFEEKEVIQVKQF